jgi:menaquinone-9 beta-reductase
MDLGFSLASHCQILTENRKYDVAIAGGGLAGLSAAILLAREGYRVCLFEKESYPFHKVCGEYISMESWDFLCGLGLPLKSWDLPMIHQLYITAPGGRSITAALALGGFGISRYKLDAALAAQARAAGAEVLENTKVFDIAFQEGIHQIQTSAGFYTATVVLGCFGKKSNLDVKWKRSFIRQGNRQNYVGVKYHVKTILPDHQIALHNFSGGYCGVSKIENGVCCFCYLTQSVNLHHHQQSIPDMEEKILKKNPALRDLMDNMTILYREPLTIAQISFAKKTQVENHVLFLGDAAGMITPLCGNGMSMALHASKITAACVQEFLSNRTNRTEMEISYQKNWNQAFATRLRTGRIIQRFFGSSFWSSLLIGVLKPFPFLVRALIKKTHGEQF